MSDRLELHHVEHIIAACQDGPNEALVLAGTLAVVATVIKQRDTAEAALLTARQRLAAVTELCKETDDLYCDSDDLARFYASIIEKIEALAAKQEPR